MANSESTVKIVLAILVVALGYFVDCYDIVIFSVVRVESLKGLGLSGEALTTTGAFLINVQFIGMLLGGLAWGILGDKRGRVEILFGSITLYSIANIANAYVGSVDQYALCRFFGGFGLAGEAGVGITLVNELMSKEKRGYGTMIVAFSGLCGVISAGLVGGLFSWQNTFIVGGIMGVVLLILRVAVSESGMFSSMREKNDVRRGSLRLLFGSRERIGRYLCCVLVGAAYYTNNVLFATFSPEIARALTVVEPVTVGNTMIYLGVFQAIGCVASIYISQIFRSRKVALYGGIGGFCLVGFVLLNSALHTAQAYYLFSSGLGFFAGYWAVYLSLTAEQFGTNLRATVASSATGLVRAFGVLHTTLFIALKGAVGTVSSIEIVLGSFTLIALSALWFLHETYNTDLNFVEAEAPANTLVKKGT